MNERQPVHVHQCQFPGCDILSGCRCACGAFAMNRRWNEEPKREVTHGDLG